MREKYIFTPEVPMSTVSTLSVHHRPQDLSDRTALALTRLLRWTADTFFSRRYGHRAVVLETVAAVPGMVGGTLRHLRSLRRMEPDGGWIESLLDEAANERMHLMTFLEVARPTAFERLLVLIAQGIFYNAFFALYLASPRTAHRLVGYFEEEAVVSYTRFLEEIDSGRIADVPAPQIARDYWKLAGSATLRDVVLAVRADEMGHRDANHAFADTLAQSIARGNPAASAMVPNERMRSSNA
jgi:ubiquinol oxidase